MALGRPILEESGCRARCYLSHQRHLGLAERVHACLVPLCACVRMHMQYSSMGAHVQAAFPRPAQCHVQWGECTHVHTFLSCSSCWDVVRILLCLHVWVSHMYAHVSWVYVSGDARNHPGSGTSQDLPSELAQEVAGGCTGHVPCELVTVD